MKPTYESAVIATDGKKKIYQTSRVIEIFKLIVKPTNNAFYGSLIDVGDVCTDEDILNAVKAYANALNREAKLEQINKKKQEEDDLLQAYKESLIDIRDCLVNSNNGKVFLLPDNHILIGQYHSFVDLECLPDDVFELIEKHSTSLVDTFTLEKVSPLTASRIMELEDDSE